MVGSVSYYTSDAGVIAAIQADMDKDPVAGGSVCPFMLVGDSVNGRYQV